MTFKEAITRKIYLCYKDLEKLNQEVKTPAVKAEINRLEAHIEAYRDSLNAFNNLLDEIADVHRNNALDLIKQGYKPDSKEVALDNYAVALLESIMS